MEKQLKKQKSSRLTTRKMVMTGLLGAITVVLGQTPLGFVPIGPLNATTMHIPVIIGAILEGPIVGALVGLIFGLSSLFNAITRPTPISIVFYNPLISILPRILIGLIAYFIYRALRNVEGKNLRIVGSAVWIGIIAFLLKGIIQAIQGATYSVSFYLNILFVIVSIVLLVMMNRSKKGNEAVMISAFLTTMAHSLMVLGGIYFLYAETYMTNLGLPVETARATIFGAIITSGVPEGILAVIISTAVLAAVWKSKK
ncbi:ECF transporter S component [Peptoniphilus sp. KCTC 25270]|uniref:ECF transporter S component n=1 Tax=Peptoniphilus sp. KCTC 25270 TaxID=2897414 RepID=UPI001E46D039|nr:ECF transporter S component [Peptoniphilus sp. KCTC 25270]MCD1147276.1 ECF transporter S component [Peptoniphilus sp. KCTC 25270]